MILQLLNLKELYRNKFNVNDNLSMKKQSFENHVRWYVPHHFVYYPILLALMAFSAYQLFNAPDVAIWLFVTIILIFLFCLSFMLRQHYALTLQDRVAKLEVRYRYFTLTGNRLELLESQLDDSKLLALRFASDYELATLVSRAISENLSSKEIKKNIKNWKGDYERV